MNTFPITPKHQLAASAIVVVQEMLNTSNPPKYATINGVNFDGESVFHCVLPTDSNDPNAVALADWCFAYYYTA